MIIPIVAAIIGTRFVYQKLLENKISEKKTNNQDYLSDSDDLKENQQTSDSSLVHSVDEEEEINQNFKLSLSALALTTGGAICAPILTVLSVPIEIFLFIPFIIRGDKELFQEKKIGVNVLDAVISIAMLANKFFFASSVFFSLYNISQKLLLKTQDRSKKTIIDIFGETSTDVWILKNDLEIQIPLDKLQEGDVVAINAGEVIPVDGVIIDGMGIIDQQLLTGEFQPVEKEKGDDVFASTIALSGKIYIQVQKSGAETLAANITAILNNISDYKTSFQARGEKIANKSAVPTLAISAITLTVLGPYAATATLLAAFGYNMRLIAPLNILNFLKIALKESCLVKDGRIMELLPQIDTVIFDKTGTLTHSQPEVGKIYCFSSYTENEILYYAAGAEYKQKHPVALAILNEVEKRNISLPDVDDAIYEIGLGIKVRIENKLIHVGSFRFFEIEDIAISNQIQDIKADTDQKGYSLICVAVNKEFYGVIELRPAVRQEVRQTIEQLHRRGLETYIISGDQEQPTKYLAEELGIKNYFAEVLPEDKANYVKHLQNEGKQVCFVGDGINDSIALKVSDISISLRDASSIAIDTAQIILLDGKINRLPLLFELADELERGLKQNLAITIIPGFICIGGVYFLGVNVISAQFLYNLGLITGVANAMRPLSNKTIQKIKKDNDIICLNELQFEDD